MKTALRTSVSAALLVLSVVSLAPAKASPPDEKALCASLAKVVNLAVTEAYQKNEPYLTNTLQYKVAVGMKNDPLFKHFVDVSFTLAQLTLAKGATQEAAVKAVHDACLNGDGEQVEPVHVVPD